MTRSRLAGLDLIPKLRTRLDALAGRWPLASVAVIGGCVTLDTIGILRSDRFDDPAWFTVLAGAGLLTAALLGGWLVRLYRARRNGEPGGASAAAALRSS